MNVYSNCALCAKPLEKSVLVPCGHYCCKNCLESSLLALNQFKCPICFESISRNSFLDDDLAIFYKHPEIGKSIVFSENSADVFEAVRHGDLDEIIAVLKQGTTLSMTDENGYFLIHLACEYGYQETVEYLLGAGVDVNLRSLVDERTPLHVASAFGHLVLVDWLVQYGADVRATTSVKDNENMPIHLAAVFGQLDVVFYFIENVDRTLISAQNRNGSIPMNIICQDEDVNQYGIVATPADGEESRKWTALHTAATTGHLEKVKELVEEGSVIQMRTEDDGKLPIHLASFYGYLDIVAFFISIEPSLAYDRSLKEGLLPIHCAALGGQTMVVEYLLTNMFIDIDIGTSNDGRTPLHCASCYGHLDLVKFLIINKANPRVTTLEDNYGEFSIHQAAYFGQLEIVKFFIEQVDPKMRFAVNSLGETALHYACFSGMFEIVEYFCTIDNSLNSVKDEMGRIPLHKACKMGHFEIVKLLINNGADFRLAGKDTWNCLHLAAYYGHRDIVAFIVGLAPASVNVKNREHYTALNMAEISPIPGSEHVVAFLKKGKKGSSDSICPYPEVNSRNSTIMLKNAETRGI